MCILPFLVGISEGYFLSRKDIVMDDEILKLALNLAFSCSLRIGEMLGLTWDCIDISDESISSNDAYIIVNKELQRVNKDTMEKLGEKDVIKKFPAIFCRNTTVLVLKTPKTASSIRKVFLPKTVALMLKKRYSDIQELIDLFGEEYSKHFEHITIPEQTYAIFETERCKFPTEVFPELRKQIYAEWLPGSGYEIADAPEIVVTHWFWKPHKNERYRELWIPIKKVD